MVGYLVTRPANLVLAILLIGCIHSTPGETLVRRKCSACHTVPTPEVVRPNLERLHEIHGERMKVTDEEMKQLRLYVGEEQTR